MRAVIITEYGGPEVLALADVDDPRPGPEEVVVEITSTALNRADLLQRLGFYPGPPMAVEIPGLEFAGRVAERGERAGRFEVGDPVMAVTGGGAHAERIAIHERQLLPVPPALELGVAGAVPEVFLTAWDALVVQGGLTPGRTALVHAGASGVGTAAIQLAKAMGARIAVTASGPKCAACLELGADLAVDYTTTDFGPAVAEFTGGAGVDVVLDVVGGEYLDRNIDALRVGGRIIQVGVMGEGTAPLALGKLLPKRASITGTVLRARPLEEKIALTQRFEREVLPWLADGTLAPVVDRHLPLDEIAEAHRLMAANVTVGKLVLDVA